MDEFWNPRLGGNRRVDDLLDGEDDGEQDAEDRATEAGERSHAKRQNREVGEHVEPEQNELLERSMFLKIHNYIPGLKVDDPTDLIVLYTNRKLSYHVYNLEKPLNEKGWIVYAHNLFT